MVMHRVGHANEYEKATATKTQLVQYVRAVLLLSSERHREEATQSADCLEEAARAVIDSLMETHEDGLSNPRLKKVAGQLSRLLPYMEERLKVYFYSKLLYAPPLQCSPEWKDASMIVDPDVSCLMNMLIPPDRHLPLAYRIFGNEDCGFDYVRLRTLFLLTQWSACDWWMEASSCC